MKRIVSLLLAALLLAGTVPLASAETLLVPQEQRGIVLQPVGVNTVEEGISPTTGLTLSDYEIPSNFEGYAKTGRYQPMLVQIDNANGGVGQTAPWGATYTDVVYESPLHANGATRISFLFSDIIPEGEYAVGPVRSARVGHCWLREEWGAGFLYYGGQTIAAANINDVFKETGAAKKGVLFSGLVGAGKPWKQYYGRRPGAPSPSNVTANLAAMYRMIPKTNVCPEHTYIFTDDIPEGDTAYEVKVNWSHEGYGSNLIYDADSNVYFRYMRSLDKKKKTEILTPYEDRDSQEQLSFANVIIQFTDVRFVGNAVPITSHIGEGNADFFMGGVHVAGYWKRENWQVRTVFYGPDGNEMPMQRGRTLIIIFPNRIYSKKMTAMGVSYSE